MGAFTFRRTTWRRASELTSVMNSWYHLKIRFKHKFSTSVAVIVIPFCSQFHLYSSRKTWKKIRLCANIYETEAWTTSHLKKFHFVGIFTMKQKTRNYCSKVLIIFKCSIVKHVGKAVGTWRKNKIEIFKKRRSKHINKDKQQNGTNTHTTRSKLWNQQKTCHIMFTYTCKCLLFKLTHVIHSIVCEIEIFHRHRAS